MVNSVAIIEGWTNRYRFAILARNKSRFGTDSNLVPRKCIDSVPFRKVKVDSVPIRIWFPASWANRYRIGTASVTNIGLRVYWVIWNNRGIWMEWDQVQILQWQRHFIWLLILFPIRSSDNSRITLDLSYKSTSNLRRPKRNRNAPQN